MSRNDFWQRREAICPKDNNREPLCQNWDSSQSNTKRRIYRRNRVSKTKIHPEKANLKMKQEKEKIKKFLLESLLFP